MLRSASLSLPFLARGLPFLAKPYIGIAVRVVTLAIIIFIQRGVISVAIPGAFFVRLIVLDLFSSGDLKLLLRFSSQLFPSLVILIL